MEKTIGGMTSLQVTLTAEELERMIVAKFSGGYTQTLALAQTRPNEYLMARAILRSSRDGKRPMLDFEIVKNGTEIVSTQTIDLFDAMDTQRKFSEILDKLTEHAKYLSGDPKK